MESLKPQDVLVVLKLCSIASVPSDDAADRLSFAMLGFELRISSSEAHAAVRRLLSSGLLHTGSSARRNLAARGRVAASKKSASLRARPARPGFGSPNTSAILEFLVHGLRYVFPASRGELTRGVPTSYAASPLRELIAKGDEPVPVWPWPEGGVRGASFEPLYRSAPYAALRDPALYELLAIADALRDGRARERKLAETLLCERLERVDVA